MNKMPILISIVIVMVVLPTPSSGAMHNIYLPIIRNEGTPQPPPPGNVYISNDYAYVNSIGTLHVVGEVTNETSKTLRFVKITANLYDSNGTLVDVDFTYSALENIPPGDKTCFDLLFIEPPSWSFYKFEPVTYHEDGIPVTGLTAINVSGSYNSTFGWYKILGEIRNDNTYKVNFVSPIITLYNGSGNVVDCDFTYVNSTDLNPGQISSFENTSSGRDYSDVANYRVQVDGNP